MTTHLLFPSKFDHQLISNFEYSVFSSLNCFIYVNRRCNFFYWISYPSQKKELLFYIKDIKDTAGATWQTLLLYHLPPPR